MPPDQPPNGIPPAYVPWGSQLDVPQPRTGLLLAAGVLALVEAAPLAVIGLISVVAGNRDRDGWGGLILVIGLMAVGIAGAWITAGVGGVLRRQWGRVLLIIGNSLGLLLSINSLQQHDNGGAFVPLLLSLAGLLLAAFGQPKRRASPSVAPWHGAVAATNPLTAAWRPDPYGRFQMRYWNGTVWTEHVATGDRQQVDPMGASTVIPFATPPSAFPELPDDGPR